MSSTPVPVPAARRNAATCLTPPTWTSALAAPTPRDAYRLALAAERARPRPTAAGHRLYWISGASFGSRDLLASSTDFVVVGRHTACDAVLEGDPTVALRHLVLRSSCLDDGCPHLTVLDLHTNDGFALADGTRQRAMAATGPVVLRVGVHVLVALPNGESPPEELPEAIRAQPYRQPARALGQSVISLLPRVVQLGEQAPANGSDGRPYAVTLQGARGRATAWLARQDVARGVLFGRAPKCIDAGLRDVLTGGISRVHLLVLPGHQPGEHIAYDLASTQGVWVNNQPARCIRLMDGGTALRLGTLGAVDLHWRAA